MALISVLIGGISGFISFVTAWLVLDLGFLIAMGMYFGVGTGAAILLLSTGLIVAQMRGISSATRGAGGVTA